MTIEIYKSFRNALEGTPCTGRPMPYHWSTLPSQLSILWMAYALMLDEFARELSNIINRFTDDVRRIRAWSTVVNTLTDDNKLLAVVEFIDTLAINTVNTPYVVKNRFSFAAAHLCHQANRAKESSWVDNLPLDRRIKQDVADLYGKSWNSYKALKNALDAINANDFRNATRDFRNMYTHRFSPKFIIGITRIVVRKNTNNSVSYTFIDHHPLDISQTTAILENERDLFYKAFEAFQGLVREHEVAIGEHSI